MRTALTIVFLLLVLGAATASADWYQVNSGTDQDLYSIATGRSDYRLVVGNGGTILHSTNNGSSWNAVQSPVSADWRAAGGVSWGAVPYVYKNWVVGGTNGQIWRVRQDLLVYGAPSPWEDMSLPTTATVNGFFGDASQYLWAVCEDGTVWEIWVGHGWVQRAVPPDTPALNSAQGGWSAGGATIIVGDNGTILRRVDHGDPLVRVESGVTVDLYDVAGGYGQPFFVIGDHGTILKSTDAGLTWTPMSTCTEQSLYYWTGYGLAWRVGGACGAYLLRDDPNPWCLAPLPTTADMFAAASVGYYGEIVVGAGGLIFKIADDRAACTCYPTGACCLDNGVCERLPADRCESFGGVWHGEGVACDPDLCDPPVCVVDPTALDFGTVTIGGSVDLTLSVSNGGGGTLEGSVGDATAPYSVISGGGVYSLGAGESVTVTVRYTPTAEGLSVSSITTGGDPVTCTGVGELAPVCVVDPTALDFGTVTIGEAVDLTFTVTNGGGGTLEGSVGTAMAPYSVVFGGGTYSLGASESVTVTVRFTPTAEGPSTSTVTTGGDLVTCTGVGELAPVCVVDPTVLDFGTVTIGEAVDLTFTVTNGGGGTLEGSVGTAMAPYSVVSGGGTYSLGASESVTVTVRFTPTTEGPSTSTVTTGGDPVTCAGVGEVPPPGSIVGTVRVGGTTLEGATVDLLDSSEALLEVMLTDATGHYEFVDRETNPYTVELVLPLGYQPADGTQLSVDVDLPPGETVTVNFDLESITQTAEARSAGYWKHQYKVHESGHGSAQESLDDLLTYQQLIFDHFYSRQDQYAIRIPGVTCGGEDVLSVDDALETLSIRGGSMSGLAHRQLLALLLNVVSGKVSTSHVASECGATVSQVITHVAQLLTDTDPDNDERAKNLAEQVNLSQLMPTDAELGEVPDITYRRSVASLESSLLFVRPNPAIGYASIFYAVPPQGADVALRVFNSSGRLVRTLVDEHASGGLHRVTWQADNDAGQPVAAGVYFSRIHVDGRAETRKIILR